MKDITVKEIIETFKGVEREEIRSTSKSDNFLDILQNVNWLLNKIFIKPFKNPVMILFL